MNNSKAFNLRYISSGEFLYNKILGAWLWFGLALIAIALDYFHFHEVSNNYIIFKYVFVHMKEQVILYGEHPEYRDVNLYGPLFSIVIAPFAILPDILGATCWVMANTALLYYSIRQMPIAEKWKNAIIILCAHEMMTAAGWFQSNALIASCIILGWIFINKSKDWVALFFILLATFIKVYGIVGFAFFFFSKNKPRFILWTMVWSVVFFLLPILLAPLSFVVQSYGDWYNALVVKAQRNVRMDIHNDFQDISVMGMIRRIFNRPGFEDKYVLLPAMLLFAVQYLHFKHFKHLGYRLYILCSVLIFTVIFSNSAESPTYIIAFPAVCFWFVVQPRSRWVNGFFVFALLLTSFSYSDIFTPWVRTHLVRPYSLKALPCFIMWLILWYQIMKKQFLQVNAEPADASPDKQLFQ